jgi:hypothetical protein
LPAGRNDLLIPSGPDQEGARLGPPGRLRQLHLRAAGGGLFPAGRNDLLIPSGPDQEGARLGPPGRLRQLHLRAAGGGVIKS